jgi:A/G-specific adenine glycosylase
VILQQTRVEQGTDYYERFIAAYPSILALASAPDDEVFKLWEGLGYYSRCRNLLHTARFIAFEKNGEFPSAYNEIAALKGVGPYTSAAIASFAFGLPHAVVDGNVIRVLSRYFGIDDPVDIPATRRKLDGLAGELLFRDDPAAYNQALMDFGATVCKPRAPKCDECPFMRECKAFLTGKVDILPVKSKKLVKKKRFLYYFILSHQGKLFVRKRIGKDIWEGLYEFVLFETDHLISVNELLSMDFFRKIAGKQFELVHASPVMKQQLTHQDISGVFIHVRLKRKPEALKDHEAVDGATLRKLAFPKFIVSYLRQNSVNLK